MILYFSAISQAEYNIGAEYINIRIANYMVNFISQSLKVIANNHMPISAEIVIMSAMNIGKSKRFHSGRTGYWTLS
jgi:hypothetical protein